MANQYTNPNITAAINPHPSFGWFHGPIPNANDGWTPPTITAAQAARAANVPGTGGRLPPMPAVTLADNAAAPNPGAVLSHVHTGVCFIEIGVAGGGMMCGQLRRHIRQAHPGAVANPARANICADERLAAESALKLYVRNQGWRNAQFVNEPGRGFIGGPIDAAARGMEALACQDTTFAATFGTQFQRAPKPATQGSNKRRKGRTPEQGDSDDERVLDFDVGQILAHAAEKWNVVVT